MTLGHLALRQAVVDGANMLVRVGAISMSHHGNFSVRVPNTDTILLTATSSFDSLNPENLALLDLDGRLLEGESIRPTLKSSTCTRWFTSNALRRALWCTLIPLTPPVSRSPAGPYPAPMRP